MKKIILSASLLTTSLALAQNTGIGTTKPDASAQLEVNSATKGMLIPRVALTATNAAAPVTAPAVGLTVFNTATAGTAPNNVTQGYYYWDGAKWVRVVNSADLASASASEPWYNEATNTPATANNQNIYQSGDVTLNGPATATGMGKQLFFGSRNDNSDPVSIYRYNNSSDKTDLRVQIGDNSGADDNFVVGTSAGGNFKPLMTVDNMGYVRTEGGTLLVKGVGNEQAYIGGDGSANDVQVGSTNTSVSDVSMYNSTSGKYMNLVAKDITGNGNGYFAGNSGVHGNLAVDGNTYLGTAPAGATSDNVLVRGADGVVKQVTAADFAAANSKNIYNTNGTVTGTRTINQNGNVVNFDNGSFLAGNSTLSGGSMELSSKETGNRNSYIDFHSSDGVDYSSRIIRSPGVDGNTDILNTGGGAVKINNQLTSLNSNGYVGLYTSTPIAPLDIQNKIRFNWVSQAINGIGIASTGASEGGWARGYNFTNAAGTANLGGFGALGGPDAVGSLWIGRTYDNFVANFDLASNLSIFKGNAEVRGFDFVLGAGDQTVRGNSGASRALVKMGDKNGSQLTVNFQNDFTAGTRVDSKLFVSNTTGAADSANDKVLTIGTNGEVKNSGSTLSQVASATEPWYQAGTTNPATANSQNIYQSGSVGIGVNNPAEKLDVAGNLQLSAGAKITSPGRLHITGDETLYLLNKNGVRVSKSWSGDGSLAVEGRTMLYDVPTGDTSQAILTRAADGTVSQIAAGAISSASEPWYQAGTTTPANANDQNIYQSGNVGIRTSGPIAPLHIGSAGTNNRTSVLVTSAEDSFHLATYQGDVGVNALVGSIGMEYNTTKNAFVKFYRGGSEQGGSIAFTSNNDTEAMRIAANGNVGIGNATPSARLTISGGFADISYGPTGSNTLSRDNAGLRGDAGARSGFYETGQAEAAGSNYPVGANGWWHLIDTRHSNNTNNFAMQLAGSFYDQNLWFRKTSNNAAQPWSKVLTQNQSTGALSIFNNLPAGNAGNNVLTMDSAGNVYQVPSSSITSANGWGLNGNDTNGAVNWAGTISQTPFRLGAGNDIKLTINTDNTVKANGSIYASQNNQTGGGFYLGDDGSIVDNNDGAATFRFGRGIKITNGTNQNSVTSSIDDAGNATFNSNQYTGGTTNTGYVTIRPQDAGGVEGGEIQLQGSNGKNTFQIDNLGGDARIFGQNHLQILSTVNVALPNGASTDQVVVADANNLLKKVPASTFVAANSQNIYNTSGTLTSARDINQDNKTINFFNGAFLAGGSNLNSGIIELSQQNAGDRSTFIDFHSAQAAWTGDYEARIIRTPGTNGNFEITNTGSGLIRLTNNSQVTGDLTVTGTIYQTSDIKFKKDVQSLSNGLSTISLLRPVTYKWNDAGIKHGGEADKQQIGFIAQEVEKVLPGAVQTDKEGNKSVNYSQVIPVLTQSVQELKKENEELKARLDRIEAMLNNKK